MTPIGAPAGNTLSVNDVSKSEGNVGTTTFTSPSASRRRQEAAGSPSTSERRTAPQRQPGDYTDEALTSQTISAGNTSTTFDVLVNGDTAVEPDETFFVNVTNVTGATVADGQGQGTIVNDDAAVCGDPFTPIYTIQGSGAATPIPGTVSTEGVVVGDFEGTAAGERLLHPGSDRRRQHGDLGRHLRLHGQRQHASMSATASGYRASPGSASTRRR